jgi:hypothetical protein
LKSPDSFKKRKNFEDNVVNASDHKDNIYSSGAIAKNNIDVVVQDMD